MFRKLLVANRGEIALRVLRTCREMGVRTVAVHSEADRWAPYVAQADEAVEIGPAPALESYLRIDRLLEAARRTGAQAIHPGYGFLSESAAFAEACRGAGIVFVGPSPAAMRAVGNKIASRALAAKLGIPVIPGQTDETQARAFAARHGWPILVKAAGGGGGRGQRVVRRAGGLPSALREARAEALHSFGNGALFIEKYLRRPRHVEIQILADRKGRTIHLGERECSLQRRHQKLLEESPAPGVDDRLREALASAACRIARAGGYENAGTCEFLVDERGRFYFLEVNARLQVEHPVTESVTGLDLVRLQLEIAAGAPLRLRQEEIRSHGHAVEARICAEDPFDGFAPSAGEISEARFPSGPGLRVDADLAPGSKITIHYDSLLAKVIAWADDRPRALERLDRALRETRIAGVRTTLPFHLALLQNRAFRAGRVHTRFVEENLRLKAPGGARRREAVLLAAALEFRRRQARPAAPVPLSPWKTAIREEA